jgi:hypothetical protein
MIHSPVLHVGGCAAWASASALAIRAAFSAAGARPLRVSCSTTAAAAGGIAGTGTGGGPGGGGLFSGRADRAEYVTISRGLFLEHCDALGKDRFLGTVEGGTPSAFFYLAQGLIKQRGPGRGAAADAEAEGAEEEEVEEDGGEEGDLADLQPLVPAWPLAAAPPAPAPRASVQLWMSPQTTTASLHFDSFDNHLCVLVGRKRVALVAPEDAARLQPPPEGHHCDADVWQLAAPVAFVEVNEGDVLAIPRGWWHAVRSDAGTMAVNWWWR